MFPSQDPVQAMVLPRFLLAGTLTFLIPTHPHILPTSMSTYRSPDEWVLVLYLYLTALRWGTAQMVSVRTSILVTIGPEDSLVRLGFTGYLVIGPAESGTADVVHMCCIVRYCGTSTGCSLPSHSVTT
jgi:hypothetical protein